MTVLIVAYSSKKSEGQVNFRLFLIFAHFRARASKNRWAACRLRGKGNPCEHVGKGKQFRQRHDKPNRRAAEKCGQRKYQNAVDEDAAEYRYDERIQPFQHGLEIVRGRDVQRQQDERSGVDSYRERGFADDFVRRLHKNSDERSGNAQGKRRPEYAEKQGGYKAVFQAAFYPVAFARAEIDGHNRLRRLPDAVRAALDEREQLYDDRVNRKFRRAEIFHNLIVRKHGKDAHGDVNEK